MTRYRITHVTTYSYANQVTASYGTHYLRPRALSRQRSEGSAVTVSPAPADLNDHLDLYGNTKTYFHVTEPHTELVITGTATVEIDRPAAPSGHAAEVSWEDARPAVMMGANGDRGRPDAWRAIEWTLESPLIDLPPEVGEYASESFTAGRPLVEAATELMHRIHDDFQYVPGSTTVTTRVSEVLQARRGVCQDFAQLMVACLRSMGLAGRYVSGYLATRPPPGRPRLVGADATHAWAACWLPGEPGQPGTWLALDPTNNRLADESHATLAWGRDYGDVTPVRGVIYTKGGTSQPRVAVDMVPLD